MKFDSLKVRLIPIYAALALMLVPLGQQIAANWQVQMHAEAAQHQLPAAVTQPQTVSGLPVRIVVPAADIDLPVVKGSYSKPAHAWSVAPTMANYATNTAPVNNKKGQTLIYGHNNSHVFGPLLNLKPRDIAYVYTDNKHIFEYRYTGSADISPDRTDIFKQMSAAGPGLKLITCDGAYFQFRHLMSFELIKNS